VRAQDRIEMRSLCYAQYNMNKRAGDAVQDGPDGGTVVTRSANPIRLRCVAGVVKWVGLVVRRQPIDGGRQEQELAEHNSGVRRKDGFGTLGGGMGKTV
jgi:hypothetical protein